MIRPARTAEPEETRTGGAFLRYLLVGGVNTLLDIGLFTLFADGADIPPVVANVLSTATTLCVSYLLNRVFVFRTTRSVQRTAPQFVTVTLISGLVVQSAVIWTSHAPWRACRAHSCARRPRTTRQDLRNGIGMISNYLGYRWLFGSR